jgi:beta-galactosidase
VRPTAAPLGEDEYETSLFADLITLQAADSLAVYSRGWHEGYHAVTVNSVGKGKAIYLGTHLQDEFYDQLYSWLLPACGFDQLLSVPEGIDLSTRTGEKGEILFVLNFRDKPQKLSLPGDYSELLTAQTVSQNVELPPYGVAVLVPKE